MKGLIPLSFDFQNNIFGQREGWLEKRKVRSRKPAERPLHQVTLRCYLACAHHSLEVPHRRSPVTSHRPHSTCPFSSLDLSSLRDLFMPLTTQCSPSFCLGLCGIPHTHCPQLVLLALDPMRWSIFLSFLRYHGYIPTLMHVASIISKQGKINSKHVPPALLLLSISVYSFTKVCWVFSHRTPPTQ